MYTKGYPLQLCRIQITDLYLEANFMDFMQQLLPPDEFDAWRTSLRRTSVVHLLPPGLVHTKNDLMVFRESVYMLDWHELTLCEISHRDTVLMIKKLLASVEGVAEQTDINRLLAGTQKKQRRGAS